MSIKLRPRPFNDFILSLGAQVASLLLNLVTETGRWEVLEETMVPLLLRSIGSSMGVTQSDQFSFYKWGENSNPDGSNHNKLTDSYTPDDLLACNSYDIPLSISCNILTFSLDTALRNKYEEVVPESTLANGSRAKCFAGKLLWDLSSLTLKMLLETSEHRSTAIKFLLPSIFKAFTHKYTYDAGVPGASHVLTRYIILYH